MSGPAAVPIIRYLQYRRPVAVDLLPDVDALELLLKNRRSRKRVDNFLADYLPHRFVERFAADNLPARPLDQCSTEQLEQIARSLSEWQLKFGGTEGYDKAEVTLGGVSTAELSSQTMESKKVPGLYFIGEVVDVTGWLGGYNFQWAWSSGFAAGQSV
jgi:predicted Rossmann fold flavoprotein